MATDTIIRVLDIVSHADTTIQGEAVGAKLRAAFADDGYGVTLSFEGVTSATTNFLAASVCSLMEDWELEEIKARLKIVESTRQINDLIKMMMRPSS